MAEKNVIRTSKKLATIDSELSKSPNPKVREAAMGGLENRKATTKGNKSPKK